MCAFGGWQRRGETARACRDSTSPRVNFVLWVLCEVAACDLAELLGSAVALQLFVRHPLAGVCIMALDVLVRLLLLQIKAFAI